jgi:hypothetical protein
MEAEGSLPHSQVPATCPYPEPALSSPYPHIPLPKIHLNIILHSIPRSPKWVPVTTVWRFLRLRMEERPPIRRVVANILNKQSRTADKGWYSSLGFGRGANKSSPKKKMSLYMKFSHRNNTLTADEIQGTLSAIRLRTLCVPLC